MEKTKAIFLVSIIFSFIFITLVSASDEAILLCLEKREVIRFSECDSEIRDYRCDGTQCQLCVTIDANGNYCPASPNKCNSQGSQCLPLGEYESSSATLSLKNPDNFYESRPGNINFEFELVKSSELRSCELMINSKSVDSTTSLSSTNTFTRNLAEASYLWGIRCETKSGNKLTSETRVIYIIEGSAPNNDDSNDNNDNNSSNNNSTNNNSNDDNDNNQDTNQNSNQNPSFFNNNQGTSTDNNDIVPLSTTAIYIENEKQESSANLGIFAIILSMVTIINVALLLVLQKRIVTKHKGKKKKIIGK